MREQKEGKEGSFNRCGRGEKASIAVLGVGDRGRYILVYFSLSLGVREQKEGKEGSFNSCVRGERASLAVVGVGDRGR